ncbi:hypothetical protein BDV95DRAFT_609400 [Massariosphaeria phaeospora]|uniref:Polynucleotide 5'-hydroxyl-kinase GRC3 n=1 Tax=Massariosphaeria phaeospora TaxID=100035 RepID=A0A7C8I4K7_9PLEO|nr:hypothetical protein BDV95DRAFT_609400 [Massariosphaeria phaeospora]
MAIANGGPLSAVAAAKLKASGISNLDGVQEPITNPVLSNNESDLEDSEPDEPPPIDIHRNLKLCSWDDNGGTIVSESDRELTLNLNKNATVALIGCYDIKVLKGAINISGANIGADKRAGESAPVRRAFVPSTHPIVKVRGLDSSNRIQFLHCREPTPFAPISPLFRDIWRAASTREQHTRSFELITESDADPLNRSLTPELIPADWVRTVEECASSSAVTLISGAPSSGKSTFAKRLVNRYLTGFGKTARALPSIYFLDLDPNAPEYTPHGQISLLRIREVNLGPSFTHPTPVQARSPANEVVRAHPHPLSGTPNFEDHSIASALDLFQTYVSLRHQNGPVPLIINTPGTMYASHFNILLHLLSKTKPQHLVHTANPSAISPVDASKLHDLTTTAAKTRTAVHDITAQTALNTPSHTAANLRDMQMQSYFHCTGLSASLHRTYTPHPLSTHPPWTFNYSSTAATHQSLLAFLPLSEYTPPSSLPTLLTGTLIHIHHLLPFHPNPPLPPNPTSGLIAPPDPRTSHLVCTALLRGWDAAARAVQVLVPRTHEGALRGLQAQTTVFVSGWGEVPGWAYVEDAYWAVEQQGEGGGEDGNTMAALPPWVASKALMDGMGYLNTVRRVRKFQQ